MKRSTFLGISLCLALGVFATNRSHAVDAPPLHGLANGTDGSNAVYLYRSSSSFPTPAANACRAS